MAEQLTDEVARLVAEATHPNRLNQIENVTTRLGVGRSTVFGLMASGRLKSVKIGRRRLIPEQALADFIATLDDQPDNDPADDLPRPADRIPVGRPADQDPRR